MAARDARSHPPVIRAGWKWEVFDSDCGVLTPGLRQLDVVCPGFSADCLETIEEID
jgi:hypothetical protein